MKHIDGAEYAGAELVERLRPIRDRLQVLGRREGEAELQRPTRHRRVIGSALAQPPAVDPRPLGEDDDVAEDIKERWIGYVELDNFGAEEAENLDARPHGGLHVGSDVVVIVVARDPDAAPCYGGRESTLVVVHWLKAGRWVHGITSVDDRRYSGAVGDRARHRARRV